MSVILEIKQNRNYLFGVQLSHIIWNFYNPDNPWRPGYVVHHKDENTLNDHISNLQLLTIKEHTSIHHKDKITTEETKLKISLTKYGIKRKPFSEETKLKMSLAKLGKKATAEAKLNMSKAQKGIKKPPKKETDRRLLIGKRHSKETKIKIGLGNKGKIISGETRKKLSESAKKQWILFRENQKSMV